MAQTRSQSRAPNGKFTKGSSSSSSSGGSRKATCSKKGKALKKRIGGLHVCKRNGPKATRKR